MELKDQKTILLIAILVIVGVAVGIVLKDGGSGFSSQDATYNFAYEDQLIIDKTGYGSMIPEDNMTFCVVSYTIRNNSNDYVEYHGSDVGLVVDGLVYGKEYSALYDDGGWNIYPGVEHSGVYVFEVPEGHGDVTLRFGDNNLVRDESITVPDIPTRSAGQVYGKVEYSMLNLSHGFHALVRVENVSYEGTISTNLYNFLLTDGYSRINHSLDTYDYNYERQEIPAGHKSDYFVIVFDKPIGWDDEEELYLIWDGYPERGMEFIRN